MSTPIRSRFGRLARASKAAGPGLGLGLGCPASVVDLATKEWVGLLTAASSANPTTCFPLHMRVDRTPRRPRILASSAILWSNLFI